MNTISESELGLMVLTKGLKRFHIVQNRLGKYHIRVTLNNQEGELQLVTTRKSAREWASLDRLANHIQDKYGAIPISLSLHTGDSTK